MTLLLSWFLDSWFLLNTMITPLRLCLATLRSCDLLLRLISSCVVLIVAVVIVAAAAVVATMLIAASVVLLLLYLHVHGHLPRKSKAYHFDSKAAAEPTL